MPASRQTYYLAIPDLARARGKIESLSFGGGSAEALAAQIRAALCESTLWQRWRAMQPDPDAVDPALGAVDTSATVHAEQSDLHCEATVSTTLPHAVLKHRLNLLIGSSWTLHDVRPG